MRVASGVVLCELIEKALGQRRNVIVGLEIGLGDVSQSIIHVPCCCSDHSDVIAGAESFVPTTAYVPHDGRTEHEENMYESKFWCLGERERMEK